jgi:hypothetical protein
MLAGRFLRCETSPMPSSDKPSPVNRKKRTPPRTKQDGARKAPEKSAQEQGVDSAHDFMRKFLKKSEG